MSINACTITSSSVDSFCSPKRAIIFTRLVEELHPTVVVPPVTPPQTGGQAVRDLSSWFKVADQLPNFEIDDRPYVPYEQTQITVTAQIFDLEGSHTIDTAGSSLDFVTVTDLSISDAVPASAEISVNISDLTI